MKPPSTPCIPRKRRTSGRSTAATPMSLLERFREVVLRLIMFSAISKGGGASRTASPRPRSRSSDSSPASRVNYRHQDSYRSEAVEDCIEFFKRSAGGGGSDGAKSSNVSEDSADHVPFAGLPLSPVVSIMECNSFAQIQ